AARTRAAEGTAALDRRASRQSWLKDRVTSEPGKYLPVWQVSDTDSHLRWMLLALLLGFAPTAAPGFVFISERSSPSTCGTRSSPLPASRHVSGVRASRATTLESARQSAWSRWW